MAICIHEEEETPPQVREITEAQIHEMAIAHARLTSPIGAQVLEVYRAVSDATVQTIRFKSGKVLAVFADGSKLNIRTEKAEE